MEKYGLKSRHLRKFWLNVDSFYEKSISNNVYKSEATQTFQKRFIKYHEKLFVFLDMDSIPWNNNAEERVIRHLAVQRKISGSFGQESTAHYLRLTPKCYTNLPVSKQVFIRVFVIWRERY